MGSGNLYNPRTNTFVGASWITEAGDKISLTNSGSYFYFIAKQDGEFLVQTKNGVSLVEKTAGQIISSLYTDSQASNWYTSCVTAM